MGPGTRVISFGSGFVLTSKHIEDLRAMGKSICEKLWEFRFIYSDVSYDAHNSAKSLTDADIKLLAQSCPNLLRFKLPGTSGLTHEALVALFEGCPKLSQVEITGASRGSGNDTKAIFAVLLERQDLAPKLRRLRLGRLCARGSRSVEMKAMRAVTRQRKELVVELVSVSEVKKWGDWELEVFGDICQRGRVEECAIF